MSGIYKNNNFDFVFGDFTLIELRECLALYPLMKWKYLVTNKLRKSIISLCVEKFVGKIVIKDNLCLKSLAYSF